MISTIITGLIAGAIAGLIIRGKGYGCFLNVVVGVIGAWVGSWIFTKIDFPQGEGFFATIFRSIVGAVAFLFVINLIQKILKKD